MQLWHDFKQIGDGSKGIIRSSSSMCEMTIEQSGNDDLILNKVDSYL